MNLDLTPEDIASRYHLLCRATCLAPDNADPIGGKALDALHKLIKQDLLTLARRGSPDNFADIYFALEQEFERFREFCAFPVLAQKVLIGFGGAFSAGKSSLINALLGQRLLATEVDPTTSLPTYLLHSDADAVFALNLFRHRIDLSHEEFLSLTHDETQLYGSNVGSLLRAAFRTQRTFPWHNLALIDTPGYSKPDSETWSARTDEQVARAQLNAAQAIVWVVSAEAGTISEDDLSFLASLRPEIPRLVVVSRADKREPKDIVSIVDGIAHILAERNLPALAVIPLSARKKVDYPLEPLLNHLQDWNAKPRELRFAHNFKHQFTRYTRFLEDQQRIASLHLNRLNRILALADTDDIQQDAQEIKEAATAERDRLSNIADDLHALRQRFFTHLKKVGDSVGIPLPEPADIDLVDIQAIDLLKLLQDTREQRGGKENDYRRHWRSLMADAQAENLPQLLRRRPDTTRIKNLLP